MGELEPLDERLVKRLEGLLNVGGAGLGAGLGAALGGPSGAVAGAVVGEGLAQGLKLTVGDMVRRALSRNEGHRVARTARTAAERMRDRLALGHTPRTDWFGDERTVSEDAAELFEGVLLAAQREYEQKKLRFYANLLANLVFRPDIDGPTANLLLRLGSSLSYRQLGVLNILHNAAGLDLKGEAWRTGDFGTDEDVDPKSEPLLVEIMELCAFGLLMRRDDTFVMDFADINPSGMRLRRTGMLLHELMNLDEMEYSDFQQEIRALSS